MGFRRILIFLLFLLGCDSVQPEYTSWLVVEAFVTTEAPLPVIQLRRTQPLSVPYYLDESTAATGAELLLKLGSAEIPYVMEAPGLYMPAQQAKAKAGTPIGLHIAWNGQSILAESRIPPTLGLDSVSVARSQTPVAGLIVDSLFIDPILVDSLGFDSLRTGAREGLVYLVEATLHWSVAFAEVGPDSAWWVRTQLLPQLRAGGRLDDYFLRPEQLQRERQVNALVPGNRAWSGVYAVPVATQSDPIPVHTLRVSVIRSSRAYALYVSGRTNPSEREPPSNVTGGLGIFTGLAMDSLSITVQ